MSKVSEISAQSQAALKYRFSKAELKGFKLRTIEGKDWQEFKRLPCRTRESIIILAIKLLFYVSEEKVSNRKTSRF